MYCRNCCYNLKSSSDQCKNCGEHPKLLSNYCSKCARCTNDREVLCIKCGEDLTIKPKFETVNQGVSVSANPFYRSANKKLLLGVMSGLAHRLNISRFALRLIITLACLFHGYSAIIVLIFYIAIGLKIPEIQTK